MEGAAAVQIPHLFLCPISLEIMADPVSLVTGITYERSSIERWMFNSKHQTSFCPVTKQPLPSGCDLTPNHTLQRLIQSWCVANDVKPLIPVDIARITNLIVSGDTELIITSLSELIEDGDSNKKCIMSTPAALDFLVSILTNVNDCDAALSILYSLDISDQCLLDLLSRNNGFIDSLTDILQWSADPNHDRPRAHATLMLKSIVEIVNPNRLTSFGDEFYKGIVQVIHDRVTYLNASKAALKILCLLCPWGRNRIKAVEIGAVAVLVELLIKEQDRRMYEMVMVVLDQMCRCAEGRAELIGHAAGIAVVSKKILRVSELASERAVRILHSVSRYSAKTKVVKEMLQVGVVSKLCLLVRADCCGVKTREKVKEILMLHSRSWKDSPCVDPYLRASYPSSNLLCPYTLCPACAFHRNATRVLKETAEQKLVSQLET